MEPWWFRCRSLSAVVHHQNSAFIPGRSCSCNDSSNRWMLTKSFCLVGFLIIGHQWLVYGTQLYSWKLPLTWYVSYISVIPLQWCYMGATQSQIADKSIFFHRLSQINNKYISLPYWPFVYPSKGSMKRMVFSIHKGIIRVLCTRYFFLSIPPTQKRL